MEYEEFVQSPVSIVPQAYERFIGLDVDKKSIHVTVMSWEGIEKQLQVPYNPAAFVRYLENKFRCGKVVLVYEAGPTGYGLFDALHDHGYDCMVTAPALVPKAPKQKGRKTNRLDSAALALRLRGGDLQGIRVPSPMYRDLRHYARRYIQVRNQCIKIKQQIKALLLMEGIAFPTEEGTFTQNALALLPKVPCRETVKHVLEGHVKALECYQAWKSDLLREVRRFIAQHPELTRNMGFISSLPGIGQKVSFLALARIGDYRLIGKADQVSNFLGLCSSEYSTGDRVRRGAITRTGDRHLRSMLIESSWVAIRRDSELRNFYFRVSNQDKPGESKRKAVVGVARKLAARIGAVLKGQRNYLFKQEGEQRKAG
jgi:transposase